MSWTLGIDLGGTKLLLLAQHGADQACSVRRARAGELVVASVPSVRQPTRAERMARRALHAAERLG